MKGVGIDGPCSVLVESAGVGGPLGAVELDETPASVDRHATLAEGVMFNVLSVGWSVGRDVV